MKVYTHPDCDYSNALKAELAELGVEYEEIDLAKRPEEWDTLAGLTDGERITPVSVEGDLVTVGFKGIG
jgi:glutaredoxin